MNSSGYNVKKAAQVAAFFAKREGGSIPILKLVKLLYLSDREYMKTYDRPILYDQFVSMDHGPVNSKTLDYVNGYKESNDWSSLISDRANHQVGLVHSISEDDLDELSDAEVHILDSVWEKFGHMTKYQLVDYTHANCPEWEDPHGSSNPIPYERMLKHLGKKNSQSIYADIEEQRYIRSF